LVFGSNGDAVALSSLVGGLGLGGWREVVFFVEEGAVGFLVECFVLRSIDIRNGEGDFDARLENFRIDLGREAAVEVAYSSLPNLRVKWTSSWPGISMSCRIIN
jgi:hypothetical protein